VADFVGQGAGDAETPPRSTATQRSDKAQRSDEARARDETEAERADRNFLELLQELRVAQTGVQILFAFLLTIAFQQRFSALSPGQVDFYIATLLLATGSTAFLIAPVSVHRLLFRQGQKTRIVQVTNLFALGGLLLLMLATVGSVVLVVDVVLGRPEATVTAGAAVCGFLLLWYVAPLMLRVFPPSARSTRGRR